jgi:Glucodextranase, domain B
MERRATKFIVKWITISLAVIVIITYSFFATRDLLMGPQINITSPENGSTVSESLVLIHGTTKNIKSISLNDRPIFIDQEGRFGEQLLLAPGYTILTLRAKDRFGREVVKRLELVRKEDAITN